MLLKDFIELVKNMDQDKPLTVYDALEEHRYWNIDTWQVDGHVLLVINNDKIDCDDS
jgi:hypothetical protein